MTHDASGADGKWTAVYDASGVAGVMRITNLSGAYTADIRLTFDIRPFKRRIRQRIARWKKLKQFRRAYYPAFLRDLCERLHQAHKEVFERTVGVHRDGEELPYSPLEITANKLRSACSLQALPHRRKLKVSLEKAVLYWQEWWKQEGQASKGP